MKTLSFLADEHVKRAYIKALRANGFEVVAVSEGENTGESDQHHLQSAKENGQVILTNDDDFVRLAAEIEHTGIIFYSDQSHQPSAFVTAIRRISRHLSPDEMENHIEWLESWL